MNKTAYRNIHHWVNTTKPKSGTCESCGKSGLSGKYIHYANISGNYKKDIADWKELCAKCHQVFDKRYKVGSLMFAICLQCSEAFKISPSRVGSKYYCSNACYAEYRTGMAKKDFWDLSNKMIGVS